MGAVSNVTEVSNAITLGNLISAVGSPAFVKKTVMMNLMYAENLPQNTNVVKFRKLGSLTATNPQAESTALAIGSGGELTDSSITATAAKCAVVSGLSVEAETFTNIDLSRLAQEQFASIARSVDNDALAMAAGLSNTVTATSTLTVDDLMLAQYTIYNGNCPNPEVALAAVLGPKAVYSVKKDIIQSGAAAWANPAMLSAFNGSGVQANGFIGSIPGVCDIYQTTGFGTSGGDDQQMLIHPMWCLAGIFAASPLSLVVNQVSAGFYKEIGSYFLYDIVEWNDAAGVLVSSDT